MNRGDIFSNESKVVSYPKWRIKIRLFDITMRVYNIFSIYFLHSFSVGKTQILREKSFQKTQDGGCNGKISLNATQRI
jgi:hypothetical protein